MSRLRRGSRCKSTEPEGCDYVIKAILLGDPGVGKTSFLLSFLHGGCGSPPNGLGGGGGGEGSDSCRLRQAAGQKVVLFHGKKVGLTVWDTAGQERYRSLTASYYRGAHACIVMYDMHNEESFNNVPMWLDSVLEDYRDTTSAGTHILLVGTVRNHHQGPPRTTASPSTTTPLPRNCNSSSNNNTGNCSATRQRAASPLSFTRNNNGYTAEHQRALPLPHNNNTGSTSDRHRANPQSNNNNNPGSDRQRANPQNNNNNNNPGSGSDRQRANPQSNSNNPSSGSDRQRARSPVPFSRGKTGHPSAVHPLRSSSMPFLGCAADHQKVSALPNNNNDDDGGSSSGRQRTIPSPITATGSTLDHQREPSLILCPYKPEFPVDQQRAQNLASHYQVPHFLVDCRRDPQSVQEVLTSLVTMVMTRALGNQQLSQSITPYGTRLQQLAKKSRRAKCSPCCGI